MLEKRRCALWQRRGDGVHNLGWIEGVKAATEERSQAHTPFLGNQESRLLARDVTLGDLFVMIRVNLEAVARPSLIGRRSSTG